MKIAAAISSFALLGSPLIENEAHASEVYADVFAWSFTIPASACTPALSTDASKVYLSNGSWVHSGTNTAAVTFVCPIVAPTSTARSIIVAPNTIGYDAGFSWIGSMQLWYRDSETASGTNVSAQLKQRTSFAASPTTLRSLSSASSAATGNNVVEACVASGCSDYFGVTPAMYYVEVTIVRSSSSQTAAFHGISFVPTI